MSTITEVHELLKILQKEQQISTAKIDELLKEVKAKDDTIKSLESRVEKLEGNLSILNNTVELLERKCDDNEQYSRRPSLRISHIPSSGYGETSKKCVELVVGKLNKIPDINISSNDIVRAHRVGKVTNGGETKPRQMIVKFKSWDIRTQIYKARKKLTDRKIFIDLTKRRFALMKLATEKIQSNDNINYAFCDINCSLGVKLLNGDLRFFNSEVELDSIISSSSP